jgi:PAS domain-containing protein
MSDLENSFPENSPAAANALTGGGQMGALIRSTDWSERPPGRIDFWPQSLRLALRIMLDAPNPSFVWWGKARINFYNDAAVPLFGKRHPDALGEPADKLWRTVGDGIGPPSNVIFNERKGGRLDQVALMVERHGFAEEAYFTFSYSPIADDGGEGGVFCVAT